MGHGQPTLIDEKAQVKICTKQGPQSINPCSVQDIPTNHKKQNPPALKIRTDAEVKTSEYPPKAPGAHKKQTPPALKIRTNTEVKTSEYPHKAPRAHIKQTPPTLKIRTDVEFKTSE